jgi:hypothetical protein
MRTDNPANVGKHAFEVAGLGKAPFRCTAMTENVINYGDGSSKAGGTCDYCSNGIRYEFHVVGADGRSFKVGCDCIAKVDDAGLLKAYKSLPEFRASQREKRWAKAARQRAEFKALVEEKAAMLQALPHSYGFVDRATGTPLTKLDEARWTLANAGAAGVAGFLGWLKRNV